MWDLVLKMLIDKGIINNSQAINLHRNIDEKAYRIIIELWKENSRLEKEILELQAKKSKEFFL